MPGPGMEVVGEEEIQEVLEVLRSRWLYRYGEEGDPNFKKKVIQLEEAVARLSQVKYAVGVNSGTTALLVCLSALGIGPGDEVIVPGYTFIASISSVIYARAIPVLTEIDTTFNLDPKDVEAKITTRTKAIMAVHMMGNPARLSELRSIADRHGIALVEDCAQAFGATYKGKPIGSIGDIAGFSFNAYKTITSGDGGMVISSDEELYKRAFALHDQGHSPMRGGVEVGKRPFIGLDFRLTELQAAVLLGQLKKLPMILGHLRTNKKRFKELIGVLPGIEFREITDPEGELATLLTTLMPNRDIAEKISRELGGRPMSEAGWHVYNNMENILEQRTITAEQCPFTCPYYLSKAPRMEYRHGMLPQTDEILGRAVNISIGVPDPGLRSSFGVSIHDDLAAVERQAAKFVEVASKYLK